MNCRADLENKFFGLIRLQLMVNNIYINLGIFCNYNVLNSKSFFVSVFLYSATITVIQTLAMNKLSLTTSIFFLFSRIEGQMPSSFMLRIDPTRNDNPVIIRARFKPNF